MIDLPFSIPTIEWRNGIFIYVGFVFCNGVSNYFRSINQKIIFISTWDKIEAIAPPLITCFLIMSICVFIDQVVLKREILKWND